MSRNFYSDTDKISQYFENRHLDMIMKKILCHEVISLIIIHAWLTSWLDFFVVILNGMNKNREQVMKVSLSLLIEFESDYWHEN